MKSKFKKIIFSLFVMFLSTFVVYADAPDNFTINGGNVSYAYASDYLPNYDVNDSQNISIKVTTTGLVTYCVNPDDPFYTESIMYSKGAKLSDQVACIISKGYNTNNTSGPYNYFTTNLAIWSVIAPNANKVRNYYDFPNGTYKGVYSPTVAAAYTLANSSCDASTPTLNVSNSNINMTLSNDGNYYVSNSITVTQTGETSGYSVTLNNAPTGTKTTTTSGTEKTTFSKGEAFIVKVPVSSINSATTSFSVGINATYTSIAAYAYTPNSNTPHQSVALLTTDTTTKSATITFNITAGTSIKIYKYIYGTSTLLNGASFTLKNYNSGVVMDTWNTTTSNPHTISNLPNGTYVITETVVPTDYEVSSASLVFSVNNGTVSKISGDATFSGTSIAIYNSRREVTGSVTIVKRDASTGNPLSGATFILRKSDNTYERLLTFGNNSYVTVDNLSPGQYILTETDAPEGYEATGGQITFTISTNGELTNVSGTGATKTNNTTIAVDNDKVTTQITIVKKDGATNADLTGAVFKLKRTEDGSEKTLTFNSASVRISNIPTGTYTLTEITAPTGYKLLTSPITFNINESGAIINLSGTGASQNSSTKITVNNEKITTQITIVKRDAAATGTGLTGAVFKLTKNGETGEKTLTFGTSSSVTVSNLTPGTYTLTETQAPTGYALPSAAITFTIDNNGKITTVNGATKINDTQIAVDNSKVLAKITIIKKDAAKNTDLKGAKFKLQKTGESTYETLNFTAASVIKNLTPGTYTLTEIEAPDGYELDSTPFKFTVSNTGAVTDSKGKTITGAKIVMYNEPVPVTGKVTISKRDATTKDELPGAKLVLKDSSGSVVDQWTSTTTPHVVEDLAPGEYTLSETTAPDGYTLNTETITFTIDEEGKVVGGTVVMENAPKPVVGKVVIIKRDATTNKPLAGAVLVLKDASGNIVKRWTTTKNNYTINNLAPGKYTITEESAPKGYILNKEPVTFRVNDDGTASEGTIVFKNHPEDNPKTGGTLIIFFSVTAVLSLGYIIYYFYRTNKSKV